MQIFTVIVTGILTFFNYMQQVNTGNRQVQILGLIAQAILTVITLAAMITYKGQRTRPNYEIGKPRIFTFGFALVVLSALGNVSVLAVLSLHLTGLIPQL